MSRSKCRLELDVAFFLCRGTSTICLSPEMDELSRRSPTVENNNETKWSNFVFCKIFLALIGLVVRQQNVIWDMMSTSLSVGAAGQSDRNPSVQKWPVPSHLQSLLVSSAIHKSPLQSECDRNLSTCQMPILTRRSDPIVPTYSRRQLENKW